MRAVATTTAIIILSATLSALVYYTQKLSETTSKSKSHKDYLKRIKIKNASMSYVDTGGDSDKIVVFLHGNPTSSYLWRNIYPTIAPIARCYAPDLIGMGYSDKVPGLMYRFADHYKYLSKWMEKVVGNKKVNLVVHDWGSALGFHWANQHREQVESIVHMESIVTALDTFDDTPASVKPIFSRLRSPEGEKMILEDNFFIEVMLPQAVMRNLTQEEMNEYRRPYLNPGEDRRPTLTWPRQIAYRDIGPHDVVEVVDSYQKWLSTSASIPKLAILASPGLSTSIVKTFATAWPNQEFITVRGLHFIQEDSPEEISQAILTFLIKLFARPTHVDYLKKVAVKDAEMSYVDTGGDSDKIVVFLHGNPTSSYLWRNIYPNIAPIARCYAPDLIGMGYSDKVPGLVYRFADHYEYLSKWMEKVVGNKKVNLVVHDWGSALGFHWAKQHREQVESIVHMESITAALDTLDDMTASVRPIFSRLRSPEGERMVIENNFFVEQMLPSAIIRNLTEEEMNEYRRPYLNPGEDRRPTLTWPREIPFRDSGPDDVIAIVDAYRNWLLKSASIPKLLVSALPGFYSSQLEAATIDFPNHKTVRVRGNHFLQEDSPNDISDHIYAFLQALFARRTHEQYLKKVRVNEENMSYVDTGGNNDRVVVFVHGNPTSSYLWRNIYPNIPPLARCFAPDLIGMGRSDKLSNSSYDFFVQYSYFSKWMEAVVLPKYQKINLVLQDWGTALGFHWAYLNRDKVQSIVYMEGFVAPLDSYNALNPEIRKIFKRLRSPEGERLVLDENFVVEVGLPEGIVRNLTKQEMDEYRRPYLKREDRRVTLVWARQIPIKGDGPDDVISITQAYYNWLSQSSDLPKLMLSINSGILTSAALTKTKNWPNHETTAIAGMYYPQEDAPNQISDVIYDFLRRKVLGLDQ